MSTRRDFLMTSAGLIGTAVPLLSRAQTVPCPPPQLSTDTGNAAVTQCVPSNAPAYIASMAPFQVRSLSGSYAPSNGSSSLRSVMPSMWAGNDDIIRPWSGGPKSTSGSKMYVHGGGHSDSSNNSLTSFDFAGSTRPVGWAVENAGQTGVTADISVGGTGYPISVHTYDGMADMGSAIYRFGGSPYPNGGFAVGMYRYDKASSVWTRLPNWPGQWFGGMALANPSAGKILAMERWATYNTYAFYRVASNSWSALRSVSGQWNSDGVAAYDPATNTGLTIGSNGYGVNAFSIGIDWSTETITQTSRSMQTFGSGASLLWDPTRRCYWCFGAAANSGTLYQIDPASFAVTARALTGDVPLTPESGSSGSFGRFVFLDSWRAIGSVSSRTSPAFVIRLP